MLLTVDHAMYADDIAEIPALNIAPDCDILRPDICEPFKGNRLSSPDLAAGCIISSGGT